MRALLKDEALQSKLETTGYAVVPFLNSDELERLNAFYSEIHPGDEAPGMIDGIHMTTWCADREYKYQVASFLENITKRSAAHYFKGYRSVNHVFIVKTGGRDNTFKVHQDWSVIDELKFQSHNIWVPLHDVDETNGALWVLEGSHKIDRPIRGAGYLFPDYSPHFDQLEASATSVPLKAGEGIIFHHSLIHGSPPNQQLTPRKAICFAVLPEEAPFNIYFQKDENSALELHEPEDHFMYEYQSLRTETIEHPPTQQPTSVLPAYKNSPVTIDEISAFLKPANKKGFFRRLFQ